ncbi:DUF6114 domain-containing protein [Streptomyces sp. H27-D2]|uniref:DUF6114 domain-containing protein n=1 Tax=Streptomyces sp. H27-D2 TaxID=3046304 RepID=UPI002DB7FDAE|nr:DUF6114 domain-containing protein [Streptomyces sp. H27-D2]MEC4018427.1 DUF6114 domain-containing protein [Streptomyces sp. H27-D2]
MSAESPGARERIGHWRQSFRVWRGQRPFWAGLLTLLGGLPIAYFPYANLTVGQLTVRMSTTAGSGSLIIGVLLVVLGLTMWFQPLVRIFAGVAALVLGMVSLVVSNFGGFLIGFLLALFGGGLAVAWGPGGTGHAKQRLDGYAPEPAPKPDEGDREDAPEPAAAGPAADDDSRNGRHRA